MLLRGKPLGATRLASAQAPQRPPPGSDSRARQVPASAAWPRASSRRARAVISATRRGWKTCAATGLSFATGASTCMATSSSVGMLDFLAVGQVADRPTKPPGTKAEAYYKVYSSRKNRRVSVCARRICVGQVADLPNCVSRQVSDLPHEKSHPPERRATWKKTTTRTWPRICANAASRESEREEGAGWLISSSSEP